MKAYLSILVATILFSCFLGKENRLNAQENYLSKGRHDSLEIFDDYYVYTFQSNLVANADKEKTNPRHFQIKLPKGMKSYKTFGLDQFAFFYKKKQCVFVYLNRNLNDQVSKDTSYIPTEQETDDIIFKLVANTWDLKKNNMQNNAYDNKRKSLIIRKGSAVILLYNILPKNFSNFEQYAKQFHFL
jgi:hypothetical protein